MSRLAPRLLLAACLVAATFTVGLAETTAWVEIDYSALVDDRELSHSGESVGTLLRRLGGRPLPAPGERPGDRTLHVLLDPLLEPYAFVLPDAIDALVPPAGPPLVEVGGLWRPGQAQPAWVEVLRARRYLVESDGEGRFRVFLPAAERPAQGSPDPVVEAERAWRAAWPVLRHAIAGERRRRGDAPIRVEVHAYVHRPERTEFLLGARAWTAEVDDTRPSGHRRPVALDAWREFLASGLRLEGARLSPDGSVRLLGSKDDEGEGQTLLGSSLTLADFAVAYRAVFHGGLAEPYMSLDRGFSPHASVVNYGGRLRDTSLGWVSLLNDIRFKTFSQGIEVFDGRDLRREIRQSVPEFRTHLERMAAHPESATATAQQTRLWFYPDDVDLTISRQGDVLVLRRVRMSAASERVVGESLQAARGEDPPWTRATVAQINADYDALSELFPEMADLDQVVRLLSLFTWLAHASAAHAIPDLDALLALELPATYTPREFPQLLAFNALPPAGSDDSVIVFERVPIAEALDRLKPTSGRPLPAVRRYARALSRLDPGKPNEAKLLAEYERNDPSVLDAGSLDLLAWRAERLSMHRHVLSSVSREQAQPIIERESSGQRMRIFSVGIGGLDLGMGQAIERAVAGSIGLAPDREAGADAGSAPMRRPTEPREAWRRDPVGLPEVALPAHGVSAPRDDAAQSRVDVARGEDGGAWARRIRSLHGADGPEVRARTMFLDKKGVVVRLERVEKARHLSYEIVRHARGYKARLLPSTSPRPEGDGDAEILPPEGLVVMHVASGDEAGGGEGATPSLRLDVPAAGELRRLEAPVPRAVLQRLVLGREADLERGAPLPGLSPLPDSLAGSRTVMVMLGPGHTTAPWEARVAPVAGEEDGERIARSLSRWWESEGRSLRAVAGVDGETSLRRWNEVPVPTAALLIVPEQGFGAGTRLTREEIESSWGGGGVRASLPDEVDSQVVVVVSAEAPALFAERLRRMARAPAMSGKLLAVWSLSGPVRADLPASLLAEGKLGGVGIAASDLVSLRQALGELRSFSSSLGDRRPEQLGGPFLWYY